MTAGPVIDMLPNFPEFKKKLQRQLLFRLEKKRTSELGPFTEVPAFTLPEGKRLIFANASGSDREVAFTRAGAEFSVSEAELRTLTLDQLAARIDRAAVEIAEQQHEHAMAELTKAADTSGNSLHAGGVPLTADHILQMLERISVDFNEAGQPELPTMIVHPEQATRAEEVLATIQADPPLRMRYTQIISQKREEWRARESRRKLVG